MRIPKGYDVCSIVLEKKISSVEELEASNKEIENFAKKNGLEVTNTCNDMQEQVRAWELTMPIEDDEDE